MADTDVFGDNSVEKMSTEDLTEGAPKEDITEEEPSKEVKEELLKEETEELKPDSSVQEIVDENGDVYEETTQVARKVVKRTMKITETSSTTKTTTMTTPAKLYGKDLSEYDEVDVDALLAQLSPEEINILAKEVDPDDNFLPPNQRCSYECKKDPTGPLDRKKLIEHINKEALETPDLPEIEPFVKGTVRGKKWVPPPRDDREIAADEQIAIDMGEEYEHALSDATQEEIIDLAAILGFHSMMNQDQYHASLLNKGQPIGMGWDGITKSTTQKLYPMDPPNTTDVDESVKRVKDDDPKLIELNLNNIKNISDEKYEQLFAVLPQNEHLEVLSLTNVGLTDKTALLLAEAIEKSKTLRVLNVETNFISPPVIVTLVKALLKARTIEEFRASNQRSTVLGNKIEMEITDLVEKNTSLLRLGLHLEFNDARHRVAAHLQRNIDRNEHEMRKGNSLSPIPKPRSPISRGDDLLSMQKAKSPKPIHLVLTPQERIDSKSELIASLVSQKQNDRERGEISLAIPQNQSAVRSPVISPVKENISPVIIKEPSKTVEDKKTDIKTLEALSSKPNVGEKSPFKETKSPTKERISPVKSQEQPKTAEDKKSDIKVAQDDNAVSSKPNINEKSPPKKTKSPIKERLSPVKSQRLSKSPEDSKSDIKTVEDGKAVSPKPNFTEKSPLKETKSPVKDRFSPIKARSPVKDKKSDTKEFRVPPPPFLSLEEPPPTAEKLPVEMKETIIELSKPDEQPLFERKTSPSRNPKIGELRHSNLSRAFDIESHDQKAKVSDTENVQNETEKPKTDESETTMENPIQKTETLPEKLEKGADTNPLKPLDNLRPTEVVKADLLVSGADSIDRDRLSESVSPSRHIEDKMTLLRAKIDSFAEVADEKMASLRSRIDDIAREPLSQIPDVTIKPRERPASYIRPVETLETIGSEPTEVMPLNLPPKPPAKNVIVPSLALLKTPNSIGITLLYQQQIFEKPHIIVNTTRNPKEEGIKKIEKVVEKAHQPSLISKVHQISEKPPIIVSTTVNIKEEGVKKIEEVVEKTPQPSITPKEKPIAINNQEKNIKEIAVEVVEKTTKDPERSFEIISVKPSTTSFPLKEESKVPVVRNPIPPVSFPTFDSQKETIIDSSSSSSSKNPSNEEALDIGTSLKSKSIATIKTDEISASFDKPQKEDKLKSEYKSPEPRKVDTRALALSLLTIKKGETLNIVPIKTTEAETQSSPKPSPLLRLSVKKGDQQTIDSAKMIEVATQSMAKPNPMSRLSIKKGEVITIDPIKKSEVSTQFLFEKPKEEQSSQTIEEDPIETLEDATQTPLVFSSLEHDYIFPGLRRVPYLPRPKSINIGSGDRVIVKPSSKPINEVLMLLYPVIHDYSKPKESKTFGLEEDLIKTTEADNTIKDLEDTMKKATEISESILKAPPKLSEEPEKVKEEVNTSSVRTEIEIPLVEESKASVASEARFETKFTAVEKVSAISRTTIESEEHVEVIDKAFKSVAEVSTSDNEKSSVTTSIKSANMWQSLSSNLIRASEQTLMDLSKAAEMGDGSTLNRTKIGKVSVYSSIEDLSRSKFSDRHLGTLIKTVETTSVYSSMEDIPYTKYSDRYKDGKAIVSTASVYSSTEDLPQSSSLKYTLDLAQPIAKSSIYSSSEDLHDVSHSKHSDRYADFKASQYTIDLPKLVEKPKEKLSLLPRSKFSDRYKDEHSRSIDTHSSSQQKLQASHELSQAATKIDRSYYKSAISADHSASRSHYKSTEELLQRSKIGTHETYKSHDAFLQTSIQSAISRNQSALRPYTYVPTSAAHTDLSIDHVRPRPSSPSTHTTTLQLNISPSGISELPSTSRISRYTTRDTAIDKPIIKISRVRDDARTFRAISPIEKRSRPSKNLLSPYHQVSDPTNDDESITIDESSQQQTLDASSASTADNETPKKRINIMDTIKMLKNRVRDVITTEDRFTESHRLPSSSSNTSSSSFTRRGSRSTGIRSKNPYDNDEKEI